MPELRPFRGLRYDAARVPDLSAVLCPPYDVISEAERERLLALDPVNSVRLELPSATPQSATDEDFDRAAATLEAWLHHGTLLRDERPMIYVYEQSYVAEDRTPRVARSFFCELRLEQYGPDSGIRPHEHTLGPAKEHRLRLLSAVRTHLSPVMLIYDADTSGLLDSIVTSARPDVATGPNAVGQRLWHIDPDVVPEARDLLAVVAARPLTIADGHHRYETALRYRDTAGAPRGADHVLALLYSAYSDGLAIAPWHRVLDNVDDRSTVLDRAGEIFSARPITDAEDLFELIDESSEPGTLGVWTREGGSLLTVDRRRMDAYIATDSPDLLRWLDVSVLSGTLNAMIGSNEAQLAAQGRLGYTHAAREAVWLVEEGRADVCFLLRPTPVDDVLAVAAAGEFMPAKSTYFYPKAATGLVFDPLY